MTERKKYRYLPDYAVPPGDVLAEYLESLGMTQAELADRTGMARKTVNEIIKGKAAITPETAIRLERTLGRPADFWSNLERQYQEVAARLAEKQRLRDHLAWLKTLPVHHMVQHGWIPKREEKVQQLEEVLRFFGIASPEQWHAVWAGHQVNYRQTERYEKNAIAVSAWLRRGEIMARPIGCAPFSRAQFRAVLFRARDLTREVPKVFQPQLVELCRTAGVAVVFVPELPKTGVYGATRWLGDRAVIQLSLRYKSNDHLWFTFFHEAGHILLHGKKEVFLESGQHGGEKEAEADSFAEDFLIPPNDYADFVATRTLTLANIREFAAEIGIAPGIVVGRLQHDELLPRNSGNRLKVFYRWTAAEDVHSK